MTYIPSKAGVAAGGAALADGEAVGADAGAAGAAAAHRARVAGVHWVHGPGRDVLERHQHWVQMRPGSACAAAQRRLTFRRRGV